MSDSRKEYLHKLHWQDNLPVPEIAKLEGTYPNKIAREMKKLGVPRRTPAEAMKLAIQAGRAAHPTAGKPLSETAKAKISAKLHQQATPEVRERNRKNSLAGWASRGKEAGAVQSKLMRTSVYRASRTGSHLELKMFEYFCAKGWDVQQNRRDLLPHDKLLIDLYFPAYNTVVEIDGPSHWTNLWGRESLTHQKNADNLKNGLLLSAGISLIRVKNMVCRSRPWYINAVCQSVEKWLLTPNRSELLYLEIDGYGQEKIWDSYAAAFRG